MLRLFEKAVESKEADTDIYTDTMASCFANRKFEVGQHLLVVKKPNAYIAAVCW